MIFSQKNDSINIQNNFCFIMHTQAHEYYNNNIVNYWYNEK